MFQCQSGGQDEPTAVAALHIHRRGAQFVSRILSAGSDNLEWTSGKENHNLIFAGSYIPVPHHVMEISGTSREVGTVVTHTVLRAPKHHHIEP